jgi:hypothetical protein
MGHFLKNSTMPSLKLYLFLFLRYPLKCVFPQFGDLDLILENHGSKMCPDSSFIYLYSKSQGKFQQYCTVHYFKEIFSWKYNLIFKKLCEAALCNLMVSIICRICCLVELLENHELQTLISQKIQVTQFSTKYLFSGPFSQESNGINT